jgi:large conductance mechanosensitive channel
VHGSDHLTTVRRIHADGRGGSSRVTDRHREENPMLKGFRDFLMRGNVVDLAVAVVVGAAFTGVVNAFAKDLIGSLLGMIGGNPNFDSVTIGEIKIGSTITALINFLIVAAVIYFLIVVPMNKIMSLRRGAPEDTTPPVAADIALLTEIRDLLAARDTRSDGKSDRQ